ncbi:redoxin family protein [Leeia sp.]|uniref:redoxin family protein n=1 Tax=Leeia sp. TaxID=2884678 RepID=UPI0035B14AAB
MPSFHPMLPPLQVQQWFNTTPLTLADLRGRVILLHVFQILCPACVSHGIPQAKQVRRLFPADQVAVIGLHSVFEHHAAMQPDALSAFLHEYRIDWPVAVDQPNPHGPIPLSMQALHLQGTPSTLLIDRHGRLRLHHFGHLDDLQLGAQLGYLLQEANMQQTADATDAHGHTEGCTPTGCKAP